MMRIDPAYIRAQVAALVAEYPELSDDEDLRVTTLEGETDVFEVLTTVLADIRDAAVMQAAIEDRLGELRTRRDRYARREDACRRLAQRIMEAAQLRKAMLPEATLSLRPAPQGVRLISPDFLPAEFWRVRREPDLAAIRAALKGGTDVPGASLSNACDVLAILTK
jgi:hypothetical protein